MQRLKTCFSLASNDIKWFEVDRRFSHDCQRPWAVGSLPREVVLDMLWSHTVESLTVDGKDFCHPLVKQGKILLCFFFKPMICNLGLECVSTGRFEDVLPLSFFFI